MDTSVTSVEKLDPRIVSVVPPSMLPPAGSMLSIVVAYLGERRRGEGGGGGEIERVREIERGDVYVTERPIYKQSAV